MPSLHAGKIVCRRCAGRGREDRNGRVRDCRACDGSGRAPGFHLIEINEAQMLALGFPPGTRPHKHKIACGMDACAYDIPKSDSVVKITKDPRDATAAAAIQRLDPPPSWAIPIRAVHRLTGDVFALVLARATKLPPDWEEPIETIFRDAADEKKHGPGGLRPHEWRGEFGYEGWARNIELKNIEKGENDERRKLRRALDMIDEMIRELAALGLDGSDFHSGNWGMYQGRPVLIDFGMATLRDRSGRPVAPTSPIRLPEAREIPPLRY